MALLSVVIPTHKRPAAAMRLMELLLTFGDSRIEIVCHSNGREESLIAFTNGKPIKFGYFEENQGPARNLQQILKMSNSDFVMLMSDEDYFELSELLVFLNWLEKINENISVVTCSIFEEQKSTYYYRLSNSQKNIVFNLKANLCYSIVPSYMSGLCWRVSELNKIDYEKYFIDEGYNSYAHLDITNNLLVNSRGVYYDPKMIIKGEEIHHGGDSYSHVIEKNENSKLNPRVYGATARAGQFFYEKHILDQLKKKSNELSSLLICIASNLTLFYSFYDAIIESNKCSYPENRRFYYSVMSATKTARLNQFYIKDIFTVTFVVVFFCDGRIIRKLVSISRRYHSKLLLKLKSSIFNLEEF